MGAGQRVVVIGGGITGVLTARELQLAGWQVTLLEAAHVGAGSSSRTAAGIRQQFSTVATVRGMRHAVDFYRRFADECDGRSPIVQNGYLFLYGDESSWAGARARVQMQQDAGLADVEAMPTPALVERFPWVEGDACLGGTWCPSDGFLLPDVVYQEGARRARELGAELVQNARVTRGIGADHLTAVESTRGTYEADLFVDCTNAWSPRLAELLGAAALPIAPLKRYLWFVARGQAMAREAFADMPLVVEPTGVYCRPENPETLMMGWGHPAVTEPAFTWEDQDRVLPDFSHNTGLDAVPFDAWMRLAEAIPAVAEFDGITATTCGYYGTTPDHNPFLGYDPIRPRRHVRPLLGPRRPRPGRGWPQRLGGRHDRRSGRPRGVPHRARVRGPRVDGDLTATSGTPASACRAACPPGCVGRGSPRRPTPGSPRTSPGLARRRRCAPW